MFHFSVYYSIRVIYTTRNKKEEIPVRKRAKHKNRHSQEETVRAVDTKLFALILFASSSPDRQTHFLVHTSDGTKKIQLK